MAADINGRVTNRDLFDAITDLRREVKADNDKLDARIDNMVEKRGELSARVTAVETKTDNLSKRVGAWDVSNSIGVIVAGILAYLGIRT